MKFLTTSKSTHLRDKINLIRTLLVPFFSHKTSGHNPKKIKTKLGLPVQRRRVRNKSPTASYTLRMDAWSSFLQNLVTKRRPARRCSSLAPFNSFKQSSRAGDSAWNLYSKKTQKNHERGERESEMENHIYIEREKCSLPLMGAGYFFSCHGVMNDGYGANLMGFWNGGGFKRRKETREI